MGDDLIPLLALVTALGNVAVLVGVWRGDRRTPPWLRVSYGLSAVGSLAILPSWLVPDATLADVGFWIGLALIAGSTVMTGWFAVELRQALRERRGTPTSSPSVRGAVGGSSSSTS
jgi:hypothetical protein